MSRQFVYFPPGRKQFYFSKSLLTNGQFPLFYSPSTTKARIIWNLIRKVRLVRNFFTTKESKLPNDIKQKLLLVQSSEKHLFQINIGTSGPEQKTTIISHGIKESTFYKIGNTKVSKTLIRNEHKILNELNGKFHSPAVLSYYEKGAYTILETNYLFAEKMPERHLTEQVFNVLCELVNYRITMNKNLITCLSHGDFCPWNMLIFKEQLYLIDWEMADERPLGYDLFTFIFQTSFLLKPNKNVQEIITEHKAFITQYFKSFNTNDVNEYFNAFVDEKIQHESLKEYKSALLEKFIALKEQQVQIIL